MCCFASSASSRRTCFICFLPKRARYSFCVHPRDSSDHSPSWRHSRRGTAAVAQPPWLSRRGSAAAALGDGDVDVLQREVDAAEILRAVGAGLAQGHHFARLHYVEEVAAVGRAGLGGLIGTAALHGGDRALQPRAGGG